MRASSDNGIDEHDFRMLYPNDDESDGQSPWLTRQDLYPMVALAGLYVVLQTVVSHPNSFTTALVATDIQNGSLIYFADARTIRITRLLLIFFTAGQMKLILDEHIPSNYWTSALLQVYCVLMVSRGARTG